MIIPVAINSHDLPPHTPGWSSVQATTADGTSEHFFIPNYCALWYDEVVEKFKIGVIRKQ